MSELFDAGFFARLNRLKLVSHIRVDRGLSGGRKSSAKGSSVEFSDFREYLPGDDIRRIDWNVYGRLDKLYVKQFMEEKEARYHIFLDASKSMEFGQEKKSFMALRLAAVMAWLVLKQLDRVEILTLQNGRLGKMNSTVGKSSFQNLLHDLEQVSFGGQAKINEAVKRCALNGSGISILISDFLEPDGVEEALRYLKFKRQEIMLVQVLAREEIAFEEEGTLALTDMETGHEMKVTMTSQTLKMYRAALEAQERRLQSLAKRYGGTFLQVIADEDMEKVVFETMKQKGIFG